MHCTALTRCRRRERLKYGGGAQQRRKDVNEDNRSQRTWKETQSPLLPPALTWSGGKKRSTHESVIHHLCLEIEKQAKLLQLSQQDDKRQKLVDSVNRYHGLFNSKRSKHRTKDKVNEVKRNACNIALWLTTPGFKKTEKRLCVVCVTSHSESNTEGGRWMSIINVSGLTVLVGLVMQNDFFIISRSFCCLQTCDLFWVSNRRHADREVDSLIVVSSFLLPNCFLVSVMMFNF